MLVSSELYDEEPDDDGAIDIREDEDEDEAGICSNCSGSGEGQYDGSICCVCHGRGTV